MERTALVTGANRGIGLEIARQLLSENINVLLGVRDLAKGERAMAKLENPHDASIRCIQLDVTSVQDLSALQQQLDTGQVHIDILVNNAGVSQGIRHSILDEPLALTQQTMDINFWGAMQLSQLCLPYMMQRDFGRVVNVSSGHGSFSKINKQNPGYRFSKVCMNALTVMLADEVKAHNILVNAMTPGWVRTRLGGLHAERSVEQGADTAVWLCLLDANGPSGQFFKDKECFPW